MCHRLKTPRAGFEVVRAWKRPKWSALYYKSPKRGRANAQMRLSLGLLGEMPKAEIVAEGVNPNPTQLSPGIGTWK